MKYLYMALVFAWIFGIGLMGAYMIPTGRVSCSTIYIMQSTQQTLHQYISYFNILQIFKKWEIIFHFALP